MSSLKVASLPPHQAIIEQPKSTSRSVLRRRLVEILPNENTEFSYAANDSIKFNISSGSEYLDGMDSYMKFELLCSNAEAAKLQSLALGGAMSLFRQAELRTQSGTLIQRYDNWNRWYAVMSSATHSPMHIEVVEGPSGDSVDVDTSLFPYNGQSYTSLIYTTADYDHTGGASERLWTLTGGAATSQLAVGSVLRITLTAAAGGTVFEVPVTAVLTANTFNTASTPFLAADVANASITSIEVRGSVESYVPNRSAVARATSKVLITMKPPLSFLQMKQWIPLMFIKQGLVLELRLERPEHCLMKNLSVAAVDANDALNYTIYNPRFCANMITLSEDIVAQHKEAYMNGGMSFGFLSYVHDRRSFSNTATELVANINFGVRSARHVFAVLQSAAISENTGAIAQNYDSVSTFLNTGVNYYQFKSGSEEFPQRRVQCRVEGSAQDIYNAEPFNQLMLTTNQHNGTIWNVRFSPKEWRRENTVPLSAAESITATSTKFIMSTRLDRNDDNFTGLDLSLNPLDIEINKAAETATTNFGNLILHVFVAYDTLVTISANGLQVRK